MTSNSFILYDCRLACVIDRIHRDLGLILLLFVKEHHDPSGLEMTSFGGVRLVDDIKDMRCPALIAGCLRCKFLLLLEWRT